ncbi:MAG: hypothetical protein ACYC4P_10860 [Thermoanaerobaculia bacterium]
MKRPFSLLLAIPLLAAGPLAAAASRVPLGEGASVPGAAWIRKAVPSTDAEANALAVAGGRIPAILLEVTPGYTVEPGEPLGLKVAMDPKGLSGAATIYLSRQDRVTGARTWYNIPSGSFGSEQRDLFGTGATPVPVNVPNLSDFVLFGEGGALGPALATDQPVGRYMFVLEVRDASGTKTISKAWALYSVVSGSETLQGEITSSRTLAADKLWVLKGAVFVRQPAVLTVERGTVVQGESATKGTLVVDRGAKIVAQGTALQPIVFTSDQPVGSRNRADWGGLILNGLAPINTPGGIAQGEGNTGSYGGGTNPDPEDGSGSLSYVRVEFAGIEFSPENELNGIAFQGTGRATKVDHVQVHWNEDDSVEFFGGTTDAKYVLSTFAGDDNLDWVEGWVGRVQWLVAVQTGTQPSNRGIEADNKDGANDLTPRSAPTVYNATFIGLRPAASSETEGIVLRRGTAGKFHNFIAQGWPGLMIDIRDGATQIQANNGSLVVDNSIFTLNTSVQDGGFGTNANGQFTKTFITQTMKNNRTGAAGLVDPTEPIMPNVLPAEGSAAADARYAAQPPDDGFFEPASCVGGVCPGNNWILAPWTTFSQN